MIALSLGHDDAHAAVRMLEAQRAILPGRGPLTGLRATSAEQRTTRFDSTWRHASDAEIALTERLESLRERLAHERPPLIVAARSLPPRAALSAAQSRPRAGQRLLLVGPHLGRNAALSRRLEQLGFRVRVEFSAHEALGAFQEHSFELVLADAHLGRSEGIELISDLQALPGVERIPVVLVDEHHREQVREAARNVGAAGYLVQPLDGDRVAAGVERILGARARRRFSRLPWRLSVRLSDGRDAFTTSVARLGAFIGTEVFLPFALTRSRGASSALAGLILSVGTLTWSVGSWLQSRDPPRWGTPARVSASALLLGAGIAATGIITVASTPGLVAYAGWACGGLGMGLVFNAVSALTYTLVEPARVGVAIGATGLAGGLGAAVAAGVSGALVNAGDSRYGGGVMGVRWALAFQAGLGVLAAIVVFRAPGRAPGRGPGRVRRRDQSAEQNTATSAGAGA